MLCLPHQSWLCPIFRKYLKLKLMLQMWGIGAVLMQQGQSIAFLSKALGEVHKHLSIYEKEFLALIMVVDKWRPYLQMTEFVIKNDHKSLSFLMEQNLHSEL
jgi:hypothetical protein